MANETCQATDHQHHDGANYYVTVIQDGGGDWRCIVGPFATHGEALAMVDKARTVACDYDPKAHWYSFGTTAMAADYTKPAILNDRVAQSTV